MMHFFETSYRFILRAPTQKVKEFFRVWLYFGGNSGSGSNAAVSAAVMTACRAQQRGQDAPGTAGKMPAVQRPNRFAQRSRHPRPEAVFVLANDVPSQDAADGFPPPKRNRTLLGEWVWTALAGLCPRLNHGAAPSGAHGVKH